MSIFSRHIVLASAVVALMVPTLIFASAPTVLTVPAEFITETSAVMRGEVNPGGSATDYWFEYGTTPSMEQQTDPRSAGGSGGTVHVSHTLGGLTPGTLYYFRVVADNWEGEVFGNTLTFMTLGGSTEAPDVVTLSATDITSSTVGLHGDVNPNRNPTHFWFEWGTDTNVTNRTSTRSAGSGNNFIRVDEFLSGLSHDTTYYFRVVAENDHGRTHGATLSFITTRGGGSSHTPTVRTITASRIDESRATLHGRVNPNGDNTVAWFEYGTSAGNLDRIVGSRTVGDGTNEIEYLHNLTGLQNRTTYYFRAVAQNSHGTSRGSIVSFVTFPEEEGDGGGSSDGSYTLTARPRAVEPLGFATVRFSVPSDAHPNRDWIGLYNPGDNDANFLRWLRTYDIRDGSLQFRVPARLGTYEFRYFKGEGFNRKARSNTIEVTRDVSDDDDDNDNGDDNDDDTPFRPRVTTLSATVVASDRAILNGFVDPRDSSDTVRWFEWGASPALGRATPQILHGLNPTEFHETITGLSEGAVYYFRAVAQNAEGRVRGQVIIFTQRGGGGGSGGATATGAPFVTTLPATNVGISSAVLNSSVSPHGLTTSTWFEYGTTPSFGTQTESHSIGSGQSFIGNAQALTGLVPGTTYYFRAVGLNSDGLQLGSTLSFRTTGGSTPSPPPTGGSDVIVVEKTVDVTRPTLSFTLTSDAGQLDAGDMFTYTIVYKNTGSVAINDVVVRVNLPTEVEYLESSRDADARNGNSLRFDVGDLNVVSRDVITVKVRLDNDTENGTPIVLKVTGDYTDGSGKIFRSQSLLTLIVGELNAPGGFFALLFDLFNPASGFFNFLLLLLLILLIAYIIYRVFARREREQEEFEFA